MKEQESLIDLTQRLIQLAPDRLSLIGAGIMVAAELGLARDSRTFARNMELAHSLVIRECVTLADELGLIKIESCDFRTQRQFYNLTDLGQAMVRKSSYYL